MSNVNQSNPACSARKRRFIARWPLGTAATVVVGLAGCVAAHATQEPLSPGVQRLFFNESIFYVYQEKYFSALTSAEVSEKRHPLTSYGDGAKLLHGGLAVAYGNRADAEHILQPLTTTETVEKTRDQAWFYLARMYYQRGDLTLAENAIAQIGNTLSKRRQAESLNLLVGIYTQQGRFEEALKALKRFRGNTEWESYARFNLGIELLRAGETRPGEQLLATIGSLKTTNPEMVALRDRANLALGFSLMRGQSPNRAVKYFEQLRLSGPFSNEALLGLGWSRSARDQWRQALVPWMELKNRDTIDPAVQEAMIAVPYGLERIKAYDLAVDHYKDAIAAFDRELGELETVLSGAHSGGFMGAMRPDMVNDERGWNWRPVELEGVEAGRYLRHLLAGEAFHRAFEDYRTLLYLEHVVNTWELKVASYSDIIAIRRANYQALVNDAERLSQVKKLEDAKTKYYSLQRELERVARDKDALALADASEATVMKRLQGIERQIAQLDRQPAVDVKLQRNKYRLISGMMQWNITRDYAVRMWDAKSSLEEVGAALEVSEKGKAAMDSALAQARGSFEGFEPRFTEAQRSVTSVKTRLQTAIARQEDHLQQLAIEELELQRLQIEQQRARARFSLARLYDKLSGQEGARK
ncbi:MAG: tetratricopeptide repeat protein [Pseudomonadota bacterium]|nr:MAG: tetratricopeptide repeat protein [Pseudomonadota bacterium]